MKSFYDCRTRFGHDEQCLSHMRAARHGGSELDCPKCGEYGRQPDTHRYGKAAVIGRHACVWVIALFWLVASPPTASAVACLDYLNAERWFQKRAGKPPDHRQIESALSRLPPPPPPAEEGSNPWQRYLDATEKHDRAKEAHRTLFEENERQKNLFGRKLPNYDTRSTEVLLSWGDAIREMGSAGKTLNAWLGEHGIGKESAALLKWFVGVYRETHEVLQSHSPDLVFRVAVHERRTMCPP